ncbi:MAG: FtsX-like permease family protein [Candidatus Heimdallarchaeota archaeon]
MTENNTIDGIEVSKRKIFNIFLKTGRKRVSLSILAGIIVFLTITSLIMVVYSYRYNTFIEFNENTNWFSDDTISAASSYYKPQAINITTELMGEITTEFVSKLEGLFPGLKVGKYTAAISSQLCYITYNGDDPYHYYELMATDNVTYDALSRCLVEGRLPQNETEVIYYQNELYDFDLNDTIELAGEKDNDFAQEQVFTIVGVIESVSTVFQNESFSQDVLDWNIEGGSFQNYWRNALFFTNYSNYQTVMNNYDYIFGIMAYLVDCQYDVSGLRVNRINAYYDAYVTDSFLELSYVAHHYLKLAPDLKLFFANFSNVWIDEFATIIGINAPLLFILGLISVVTLNIGSKDLASTFRRMKLYGLSYRIIRQMVLIENLIFTFVSFVGGVFLGLMVNFTFTANIPNRPANFYANFFLEPLLLIAIASYIVGFFFLSYFIQNSIAKQTTKDAHDEYAKKRRRIRTLFSTNEFRLFVITLAFSLVSVILYLLYTYVGPEVPIFSNYSYITLFYFLITCSIAFCMTFVFLIIARLLTLMWSLISRTVWRSRINSFTLSIKHLVDNKNVYQITILSTLIFGLVVLPGFAMMQSIPSHLQKEAKLSVGGSNLIVEGWLDPEDERDYIFQNMTEIQNFTEVYKYLLRNSNEYHLYTYPYEISMLAIENPDEFIATLDDSVLPEISVNVDDIKLLNNDTYVLMDKDYVKKYDLQRYDRFYTTKWSRRGIEFRLSNSFDYFPLINVPKKQIFSNEEVLSIVGSKDTIREFTRTLDYTTDFIGETLKIIKAVNESAIPMIQENLEYYNITSMTIDEYYEQYYNEIELFSASNLMFFSLISAFTLLFIGYFTGLKIYDERLRVIESLYRSGAERRQILGLFTLELTLINIIPMIASVLASIPLIRFLAVFYLDVREQYILFSPDIPVWIFIVAIVCGMVISMIGWFIALIPAIYTYRPIKQE